MTKVGVVDYWMIHRLLDAMRHIGAVDKHEMSTALQEIWTYAKEAYFDDEITRR